VETVGVQDIADMRGVSRQRADQITREKGFPDPLPERRRKFGRRRRWDAVKVRAFFGGK